MIAILPQNGEKRRFRNQKNLLVEASSYFPIQSIDIVVAQGVANLRIQNRIFATPLLSEIHFSNPPGLLLHTLQI